MIRLAKDRLRLAAIVVIRAAVAAAGFYTWLYSRDIVGLVILVASSVVLTYAGTLALYFATVRIEVIPTEIHVVWAWGRTRYRLSRGAVTRIRQRATLRRFGAQLGGFGIEVGGSERHEGLSVVRLSTRVPVIVVPTGRNRRLAVAPVDQDELVSALTEATRLRRIRDLLGRPLLGIERARIDV